MAAKARETFGIFYVKAVVYLTPQETTSQTTRSTSGNCKKKKTTATTNKRKLLIIIEVFQRSSNYKSRKHTVLERQITNQVSYLSSITFRCSHCPMTDVDRYN